MLHLRTARLAREERVRRPLPAGRCVRRRVVAKRCPTARGAKAVPLHAPASPVREPNALDCCCCCCRCCCHCCFLRRRHHRRRRFRHFHCCCCLHSVGVSVRRLLARAKRRWPEAAAVVGSWAAAAATGAGRTPKQAAGRRGGGVECRPARSACGRAAARWTGGPSPGRHLRGTSCPAPDTECRPQGGRPRAARRRRHGLAGMLRRMASSPPDPGRWRCRRERGLAGRPQRGR